MEEGWLSFTNSDMIRKTTRRGWRQTPVTGELMRLLSMNDLTVV